MPIPGDKKLAEKRAADLEKQLKKLEKQLADQQTGSKKELDEVRTAANLREKEYALRLSGLTRAAEG